MDVAENEKKSIDFEGIEDVFRICGRQTGMAALDQRIAEYVKATDPRVIRFLEDMEKYDKPRLQGSPASEYNMSKPDLNYFAPMKHLQVMLCEEWFDKVSTDKKMYTRAWRETLVLELMKSEHGDYIARKWSDKTQRLQIKGHVVGALKEAGVLKGSDLAVARAYLGKEEKDLSKEVKTFAKYMGNWQRWPFAEWIQNYAK